MMMVISLSMDLFQADDHNGYENVQAVLHWMEEQKFTLDQLV